MSFMEKLPRLDICCGCIPLRTGVSIVAILGILGGFSTLSPLFGDESQAIKKIEVWHDFFGIKTELKPEIRHYGKMSDKLVVCFGIYSMVTHLSLLIGVCMRKQQIIRIYLWFSFFYILFICVSAILIFTSYPLYAIGLIFVNFLTIYCVLCINSYYLKLKRESDLSTMV